MKFTLAIALAFALASAVQVGQQEKYSDFERDYYDLDYVFGARVTMADGSVVELTNFRTGRGLQKHMILSASEGLLNIALKAVRRIDNIGEEGWATIHFEDDVEMRIKWSGAESRMLRGTLPDGGAWDALIGEVRTVEVYIIDDGGKGDAAEVPH